MHAAESVEGQLLVEQDRERALQGLHAKLQNMQGILGMLFFFAISKMLEYLIFFS